MEDIPIESRSSPKKKTSMSVPEMRRLLGLGKTESYWLVHKKYFVAVIAAGKMRVMLDSFEDWYAGQFHYKKVCGNPPGEKWAQTTMSVKETADTLGLCTNSIYDLLPKNHFSTLRIVGKLRIDRDSFEKWLCGQSHYKRAIMAGGDDNGIHR